MPRTELKQIFLKQEASGSVFFEGVPFWWSQYRGLHSRQQCLFGLPAPLLCFQRTGSFGFYVSSWFSGLIFHKFITCRRASETDSPVKGFA